MAAGKVHHWKHGWIPLTAWARAQVAKHHDASAHLHSDEERRARYAAHLKATQAKRAAQSKRYQDHLNATADKRAATQARYLAAQNRKHR